MAEKTFADRIAAAKDTGKEVKFYTNDALNTGNAYDFTPAGLADYMRDELRFPKVSGAPSIGPKFAILGDSITEFCSGRRLPPLSSPTSIWRNDGYAAWLRILSNQRVNLPLENNFGVSGDRLDQMLVRVPAIVATKSDYCVVEGGTNDITQGTSFSSMTSTWTTIVETLRDGGVIPIATPIIPRGDTLTTEQILKQLRFNNFVQEYCLLNNLIFVNWNKYLLDMTSATNAPLSGMTRSDNIHPGIPGGFWMGKALADEINLRLPTRETSMVHGPSDYYHATYNPTGNLCYNTTTSRGTMAGTGGTATASAGLTYVNNGLAAGWTVLRGTSTSTCTVTLSKEAKAISGERQVIQIAAAADGGTDEIYNLRFSPSLTDVVEGDIVYGEATIEVSAAPTRVRSLEFYLFENRSSSAQTAIDNGSNDSLSGFLPAQTWTGTFRTPPITRQSDTTALQANIRVRLNASGGTSGITIKVGDFAVRKVN